MDKERVIKSIETEASTHEDVKRHYADLKRIFTNTTNEFDGIRILIFQPCAIGDNVVASLGVELLHRKFPGCTVDFLTSTKESICLLESNPFINKVILNDNWEVFNTRDTRHDPGVVNGCPSIDGPLKKEYDLALNLYWWNPPMVESFLSDLGLDTSYTRVRIYTEGVEVNFKNYFKTELRKICIQKGMGGKWSGDYHKLLSDLKTYGEVIEISPELGLNYVQAAMLLSKADLTVCAEGSMSHIAAAVGCQTVTLSSVYNPKDVCVEFYQNKYLPENKKHITVVPKDFCGNYRCISYKIDSVRYEPPPYRFPEPRTPPHMFKPCDYKNFQKTCIHEIKVSEIVDAVNHIMETKNEN